MKVLIFSALVFLALLFSFCKHEPQPILVDSELVTDDSTVLVFGKCAFFQNQKLTICFEKVNEYRCPCWGICIWAGAVDAEFSVKGIGIDTVFMLTYPEILNYKNPNSIAIGNHKIRLGAILPEVEFNVPCEDFYGIPEKYSAQIFVE